MDWTALVPVRIGAGGKSRLGAVLDSRARADLACRMAHHVIDVLAQSSSIARIIVLSDKPFDHPSAGWAKDEGRGLNPEIAGFRRSSGDAPLLVIHADLPLLSCADVAALLRAGADHGAALATDRAGEGTNALALADGRPFDFRFGPGSRALHCTANPAMPVIHTTGTSADLDTPDDLAFLRQHGFHA